MYASVSEVKALLCVIILGFLIIINFIRVTFFDPQANVR